MHKADPGLLQRCPSRASELAAVLTGCQPLSSHFKRCSTSCICNETQLSKRRVNREVWLPSQPEPLLSAKPKLFRRLECVLIMLGRYFLR